MPDILIRNVPEAVVRALTRRAELHGRSLDQEIALILREATRKTGHLSAARTAAAIRTRLATSGRSFGDSVELIREDRER